MVDWNISFWSEKSSAGSDDADVILRNSNVLQVLV